MISNVLRYEQGMSNDVGPNVTYSICQCNIKKEVNKSLEELLYNLWHVDMNKEFPLKRHFIQKNYIAQESKYTQSNLSQTDTATINFLNIARTFLVFRPILDQPSYLL